MTECLTNNEWERIWKEEVVALCKVLSRYLGKRTEENHERIVRIAGLRAEIWTRYLPSTKQANYPLDYD
jgi:hypothetical protein